MSTTLHRTSGRWRYGLSLSVLTMVLWGILPIALHIMLQTLDAYTVTWFRFGVAFLLLFGYLGSRRELPKMTTLKKIPVYLLILATVFLGANYLLYLQGLGLTSPATAQVLIQLAPVLLGLGGLFIFKERYTLSQWLGLGMLGAGFGLFFWEQLQALVTAPGPYLLGSLLIVVAAFTWAIYALAQKQLLQTLPSSNVMLLLYGGCAILITPLAQPLQLVQLDPWHWVALLFCALNTLVAYGSFAEALEHWEASRVGAVLTITPLTTLAAELLVAQFFPQILAPEHFTLLGLGGALLVVGGSLAMALGKK